MVVCPLCKKVCDSGTVNQYREKELIKELLKSETVRIFWAHGSTTNDYDQNYTGSRGFFYILRGNELFGDIIWG